LQKAVLLISDSLLHYWFKEISGIMKNRVIFAAIYTLAYLIAGCASGDGNLNFAFLTDIHVTPGSVYAEKMSGVVDELNASGTELIIITGDLTNSGSDAELNLVKSILDSLRSPYLVIPGNHETNWSESGGTLITELWGNDRFVYESGDYLLVGFSTGPFMKMSDGHVKKEDILWLREVLSERKSRSKRLLAFSHYPLTEGLDNWYEVTAVLKEYDCLAVFCGHGHRLTLYNFDGIPGIMGRALIQGNPPVAGYNMVNVSRDSLVVSEKLHGKDGGSVAIGLSLTDRSASDSLPVSPLPDFSLNNEWPQVSVTYEWTNESSILSGVSLAGDSMFIFAGSDGLVRAVNHLTDTVVWERRFPGPVFSTPVITGNMIVFGAVDGKVYGLDTGTGSIAWSVDAGAPVISSPESRDGKIYIGGGKKSFLCIDSETGDLLWSFDAINGLIQGKPALHGDNVVFGAWDTHLYNLNAHTGELRWKWNNGRANTLFSPGNIVPAISSGKVFIVAPDRFMTAIDLNTGREVWRTSKHQVRESMGLSPDGSEIYAKLMNDSVVSIQATGEVFTTLWSADAGIGYDHNPCPLLVTNSHVIAATKNGLVTAINRQTRKVDWMHKVGNSSVNNLVTDANNNIWLSLPEGKIIRLSYSINP